VKGKLKNVRMVHQNALVHQLLEFLNEIPIKELPKSLTLGLAGFWM
jgi:hypothetical protein